MPACGRQVPPPGKSPYHVGGQQTAGVPVGQTGVANPSTGGEASEQQVERQEKGCQSGVPHGLPLGQGVRNMAERPERWAAGLCSTAAGSTIDKAILDATPLKSYH